MRVFCTLSFSIVFLVFALSVSVCLGGSVVTVDPNHTLVVNGRKVFPIGFSPGPPLNSVTPEGKDALQELRDAGGLMHRMNQSRNWDAQLIAEYEAVLDWAGQHDMFIWLNLREISKFAAGDTATEASLRDKVIRFKDHPALGLWKNYDEAWWGGISAADLKRGYDVIKELDTNHPVMQTHAPRGTVEDLRPYNAATDILALDIYPVGYPPGANSLWANKEISMVGDYALFLDDVGEGQKQYWLVEQIAWSGVTNPGKTLRFPTFTQSRYMAYQAIVNGARGLMFFGGNNATALNSRDAAYGWNWTFWETVLRRVVLELGDRGLLTDALTAPDSSLPVVLSGAASPNIEFCVREAPPYLYIIACKREGATLQATFSGLPPAAGLGEVLYESPRTVTAINGSFTDWFGEFEVHAYRFLVTNEVEGVSIQIPPVDQTRAAGTTAMFQVGVAGADPVFQWRKNGTNLVDGAHVAGATTSTLTLANVLAADAGTYSVLVTNSINSVTSSPAALTVIDPAIVAPPQDVLAAPGSMAFFSVTAAGTPALSYRWTKNSVQLSDSGNISGSGSDSLSIANAQSGDDGAYAAIVTGAAGSITSPPAILQVNYGLYITEQPASRTNNAGSTAQFLVAAHAPQGAVFTCQWLRNGVALSNGSRISGAQAAALSIARVSAGDEATYRVVVTSGTLSVTSAPAVLTVIYPMPFYEPFSYPAAQNLGGQTNANFLEWHDVGTSTAGPYIKSIAGSLSVSGLAPSSGNSIQFGGLGKSARFSFPPGNAVSSGELYYSLIFKLTDSTGLSSSGKFVAGFNNSIGTQSGQPTVIGTRLYVRSSGSGFNLGLSKNSSTTADWVWDPRVFTNNQMLFIVGRYAYDAGGGADVSALWVNPDAGAFSAAVPPAPPLTSSAGNDFSIASFVLFQRDSTEPAAMVVDELRIAPTWAGVTPSNGQAGPVALQPSVGANGLFQIAFTNNTGRSYSVHASPDLVDWINLGAVSESSPGVFQFTDPEMSSRPRRFFKLQWP